MRRNKFKFSLLSSLLAFGSLGLLVGGLASCDTTGGEQDGTTPDTPTTPTYTLTATATGTWQVNETLTVTATVNGESITDFTVEATTGAGLVTVEGNTVTLNRGGSLVLTVSTTYESTALTTTVEGTITDPTYADAIEISISELLKLQGTDFSQFSGGAYSSSPLYKVQGIAIDVNSASTSGRFYLVDETTGDELYLYYVSDTYTGFTYDDGVYTYTRNYNFVESGWGEKIESGDRVTLMVIYGYYGETIQGMGELYSLDAEREDIKAYKIDSMPEYLTASKSEGLVYGEEVTLTVNEDKLPEGQQIKTVQHNGTGLVQNDEGNYTFNVAMKNEITCELVSSDANIVTIELTTTNLGISSGYTSNTGVTVDGATFAYNDVSVNDGNLQMNAKSDRGGSSSYQTELWNTSTLSGYTIDEITFNIGTASWASTAQSSAIFRVYSGTTAITEEPSNSNDYKEASYNSLTVSLDDNATYFYMVRYGSGATYLNSIVITFVG